MFQTTTQFLLYMIKVYQTIHKQSLNRGFRLASVKLLATLGYVHDGVKPQTQSHWIEVGTIYYIHRLLIFQSHASDFCHAYV